MANGLLSCLIKMTGFTSYSRNNSREISRSKNDESISTLNAGCGITKWGDIRIDIEDFSTRYEVTSSANLIAAIQYLPFRDDVFVEARCFHVLEHVKDPLLAISELKRTSVKTICRVPIWHLYSFIIVDSLIGSG